MFMHIGGRGSVEALATAVARAIAKVAEIRRSLARPPVGFLGLAIPEEGSITPESIKALGHGGGGNASELFSQALRRHAARRERSSQTSQRIVVDTYPFPSDPFYPIRKAFRGAWLVEDLPDPGLKKKWSVALTERGKFVIYSYEDWPNQKANVTFKVVKSLEDAKDLPDDILAAAMAELDDDYAQELDI